MNKFKIGDKAKYKKSFSFNDVAYYSKIMEDSNLIHYNSAKKTNFRKNILHGQLVASLFGGLLGSVLLGEGTIHLGKTLSFKAPVFIDDMVLAEKVIFNIRQDKPLFFFDCKTNKAEKNNAIEGEPFVLNLNKNKA